MENSGSGTYRIGSFNLRDFNFSNRTAEGESISRDFHRIADIIRKEKFDVVAIQEVNAESPLKYLKDILNMAKSPVSEWAYAYSGSVSTATNDPEGYAFLWNRRRLRLAESKSNGVTRTFSPRISKRCRTNLDRLPYYGRFTPQGLPGGSYFEIRLICVHTHYGRNTRQDQEMRKRELDSLLKEIYPQISTRVYKDAMPSYTILLGDYNVELWRDWKDTLTRRKDFLYLHDDREFLKADQKTGVAVADKWDNMRVKTAQYEFSTLKEKEPEEDDPKRVRGYSHDYDHFSFNEDAFAASNVKVRVRRIDAVRKYYGDDFAAYRKAISDHVPIVMTIELKGEENGNPGNSGYN